MNGEYKSFSMEELELSPPWLINNKDLIACVIYQGIVCKTWPTLPRKADIIVQKLTTLCEESFERISDDFYLKEFHSYDDLCGWLKKELLSIFEIEELNLTHTEFEAGVKVHDESRAGYVFTDRYSPPCLSNDDFIDLDAFYRNVAHDLLRQRLPINFSTFR